MATTRVFKSGNSQAVRLPKEFSIKTKVVEILRRGDEIVLREPGKGLERAFEVLTELPDDFFSEGRRDSPPQQREGLRWRCGFCWIPISAFTSNAKGPRKYWRAFKN